jgi:hypothetical protein
MDNPNIIPAADAYPIKINAIHGHSSNYIAKSVVPETIIKYGVSPFSINFLYGQDPEEFAVMVSGYMVPSFPSSVVKLRLLLVISCFSRS